MGVDARLTIVPKGSLADTDERLTRFVQNVNAARGAEAYQFSPNNITYNDELNLIVIHLEDRYYMLTTPAGRGSWPRLRATASALAEAFETTSVGYTPEYVEIYDEQSLADAGQLDAYTVGLLDLHWQESDPDAKFGPWGQVPPGLEVSGTPTPVELLNAANPVTPRRGLPRSASFKTGGMQV